MLYIGKASDRHRALVGPNRLRQRSRRQATSQSRDAEAPWGQRQSPEEFRQCALGRVRSQRSVRSRWPHPPRMGAAAIESKALEAPASTYRIQSPRHCRTTQTNGRARLYRIHRRSGCSLALERTHQRPFPAEISTPGAGRGPVGRSGHWGHENASLTNRGRSGIAKPLKLLV